MARSAEHTGGQNLEGPNPKQQNKSGINPEESEQNSQPKNTT